MLSAIEIVQWVYSEADPAHIEELLLCNESQLAVIIASCCGDIRFRHDASDVMLGLDGAGTTGASPHLRLPQDGVFHRIVGEALAGEARSVLWHVQIPGRGDWLIVACGGTFDGSASAFLVVGRVEPRRTDRGATAPVNAPRAWPNSSESSNSSGMAAQLTSQNRRSRRALS